MTTHHEKILHFYCGYFQPCVCVPLFGPGGLVFKVHMVISRDCHGSHQPAVEHAL